MGQRHQLFVVAKINGRYRTLCAIHHQWLYGQTALRRCLGTLRIFQDPANRVPLQRELIAAERHDEAFWTATGNGHQEENSDVPFPFIATCLITGASFDPQEGYYHSVMIESFFMAYDEGDNNNGITVFDVTDSSNVRYCFVDYHGMESERSVQLMTPLTARTYLEAYYDLSNPENSMMLSLLKEFNEWHIISVETLQDTWPEGEWEEPESEEATADEVAVAPKLEKLANKTLSTSKSLREGAMNSVLQALLDGPNNSGLLPEAELLSDFVPTLKEKLYEQSYAMKPAPYILDLLCRALEEEIDVDLSPFITFTAEDLSLVVSRLRKHGKMQTLCISNTASLSTEDVQIVLRDATGLKALYLLDDPQISAEALGSSPLLKDCDFYSSDLLRRAIKPRRGYSSSYYSDSSDADSKVPNDAMPISQLYGNSNISQLVWIGLSTEQALDKKYRLKTGLINWETLQQDKRRDNFGWYEDDLRYRRYRIDMPLSASRTVAGLLCLLQWRSSFDLYDDEQFSNGAALSFALAPTIKADQTSLGIGPLAPGLYRDGNLSPRPTDEAHEFLGPRKWAILLVHEAYNARSQKFLDKRQRKGPAEADSYSEDDNPHGRTTKGEGSIAGMMALLPGPTDPFENKGKNQGLPFRAYKRLRYAFVTPCTEPQVSDHDFTVADLSAYLKQTVGEHNEASGEKLKELVELHSDAEFYGDEDIHEILPKVFPKQSAGR